jgi:hypothetical protein
MRERLPQGEYRTYLGVLLKNKSVVAIGLAFAVVTAMTACGSGDSGGQELASAESQSTCFTALDDTQKAQLTQYVAEHKDDVTSTTANADGTQDICVLESDGSGGYNQHYYKEEDNFNDYLLYSMMFGRSNTLLAYGLISDDLDVSQYLALSLLTGVNNNGQMYHPYTHNGSNWGRNTSWVNNGSSYVKNVRFGSKPDTVPYAPPSKMAYPIGYKPVPLDFKPGTENDVASVKKGPDGKTTLTKKPGANAQDTLKTFPKSTPPPAPKTSTNGSTTNKGNTGSGTSPNKSGTGSGSTSNKGTTGNSGTKPGGTAPKSGGSSGTKSGGSTSSKK